MSYIGHKLTVRRYRSHIGQERTRGALYCAVSGPSVRGQYAPVYGGPFAALLGACRWVRKAVQS